MRLTPIDMISGSIHKTKSHGDLIIIKYNSKRDVEIEFVSTGYRHSCEAVQIRRGGVKDKMIPSVFGVGFIGGDKYTPKVEGVITKAYAVWQAMLRRCYSEVCLIKQPTYQDCTVSSDWHNFQVFAEWFDGSYPLDGNKYDLDKDIKIDGNREYSSDTCLFVSAKDNRIKASAIGVSLIHADGTEFSAVSCAEAARNLGMSGSYISKLISGKINSAKGWRLSV